MTTTTKRGDRWQVSWTEGGKRRKKSGFVTKKAADHWRVLKEQGVQSGISRPEADKMTVSTLAAEFLEHSAKRVQREAIGTGQLRNLESHCYNYIARPSNWRPRSLGAGKAGNSPSSKKDISLTFSGSLGHLKLAQLRPSTVEKFRDDLLDLGLSHTTVRAVKVSLQALLDYGRRRDYISVNPASRIKVEVPQSKRTIRVEPPPRQSVRAAIEVADEPLRTMIQLTAITGLRLGEMKALRYRHLDFPNRTLNVRAALKHRAKEGLPKSAAGVRDIPLDDQLIGIISIHRSHALNASEDDLVFPGDTGLYLSDNIVLSRLYAVFNRQAWPSRESRSSDLTRRRFHWHALRHYAISSWIASGLGLKAVQTFAGHEDIKMTWDRYGHLFPDEDHWVKMGAAAAALLN